MNRICARCNGNEVSYSNICNTCAKVITPAAKRERLELFKQEHRMELKLTDASVGILSGFWIAPFLLPFTPDVTNTWWIDYLSYVGVIALPLSIMFFKGEPSESKFEAELAGKDAGATEQRIADKERQFIAQFAFNYEKQARPAIGIKDGDLYVITDSKNFKVIKGERIDEVTIYERKNIAGKETITHTTKPDAVGRALVGGAIAGPQGAIVGALSADEHSISRERTIYESEFELKVVLKNPWDLIRIDFRGMEQAAKSWHKKVEKLKK